MTAIQIVIACIAIQVNYTRLTIERIVSNWIPIILQIFQNAIGLFKTTYLTKSLHFVPVFVYNLHRYEICNYALYSFWYLNDDE